MANSFDDGVFWLPPEFLADEDVTATPFELKNSPLYSNNGDEAMLFPLEFPYGFSPPSDLSSPVESLGGGSSETESDEEEQLVAELTRRMARSSLNTDLKSSDNSLGRFVSGSPQSTLCAFGNDYRWRKGSSPNGFCKVSSAKDTWDVVYEEASGEVEKMRLNQEGYGLFVPPRKPSPVTTLPSKNITTDHPELGFFTQQSLSHLQLQIAQFQMLRHQQMAKQQKQCGGCVYQQCQNNNQMAPNRARNSEIGGGSRPFGLSQTAWPSLQHAKLQKHQNQQYPSAVGAFPPNNNPSGRRVCAGTGVFLPRRVDTPAPPRKKPARSTVIVPNRVAQALNLNLEELKGRKPQYLNHFNDTCNIENGGVPRHRSNYQQKRNPNLKTQATTLNNEIRLPQEWTY